MNSPSDTLAAAAASLAGVGWRVHPLRPGSKLPLLTGWPERATSDAATVATWWTATPAANVAIATGAGVFVLDVDTADGKPGAASLAAIEAAHGPLPVTLEAATASGGRHLYFASHVPVRNSAGKLGEGLDVRGMGGYVVAAPSVTDRGAYRWARLAPVAPAPDWLVRLALNAAPTAETAPAIPASVEPTPEMLDDLRSALAVLPADNRTEWIAVGAALRPLGDVGRDLWTEWSATSPKHDPRRDLDTWETIGHDTTGPAAIFARAQRAGWVNPRSILATAARVLAGGATCMEPRSTLQPVAVDDVLAPLYHRLAS